MMNAVKILESFCAVKEIGVNEGYERTVSAHLRGHRVDWLLIHNH